jgi:hypothetical protein
MYTSKTGKKFGSSMVGKKYDEMHSEDGIHQLGEEHEAKETPEFEAGEQEGAVENKAEGEEHDGEEHPAVAEHGPAHKVVISHDEKAGRHTVTSHHKDGHMHTEMHEDVHKAHHAGKRLAGIHDASEEEKPAQHAASAAAEEDGFQMPGLE